MEILRQKKKTKDILELDEKNKAINATREENLAKVKIQRKEE